MSKELTLCDAVAEMFQTPLIRGVVSNPKGETPWKKVRFRYLKDGYQLEKLTEKQAFHENMKEEEMPETVLQLAKMGFRQIDGWNETTAFCLKVSKKGTVTLLKRQEKRQETATQHNREKQYLLKEDTVIPPLVDLGVITKEGKVVQSMYHKFRQINRFTELIRDGMEEFSKNSIRILDFGCGKSYLTFILYHYLVNQRGMDAEIIGLDLKTEVIANCNRLAGEYGYDKLTFQAGDVSMYQAENKPDMVITLHACDTATDYALFHAIRWGCELIYSVPCCQHELNGQIQGGELGALTRYGLIQERFSALCTDALRGALLEACGYRVQMLEFVDFSHSPKNLLIRAVKKPVSKEKRQKALKEAKALMKQFSFTPTLYRLLDEEGFFA
ncbi:MAG: SAM-dependent methyltransferase [Clostridia bacterium]|nr:SAM-dependent methyltransferase [Clostridia bacterium]